MSEPFIDERGVIEDILEGPIDAVTRITTVAGAVRGNHVHDKTAQWTYVISGRLRVVSLPTSGVSAREVGPGEIVLHRPTEPHAWQALVDTDCFVFTCGPRSGEGYESDTVRLETPLIV